MKPIMCLPLAIALSTGIVDAQPKKDPPKEYTNSIGIKFVSIPPGTYLMGSSNDEKDRNKNETQHKVKLTKGFYMGVTTVTKSQWHAVMKPAKDLPKKDRELPMETVSWDECQEFIKKLRAIDNKPYRLPTEAEWEYACRAGTTTAYYCGSTLTAKQATFGKGMKGQSKLATTPVRSHPGNPWGLHDMHGNVWQWCQDWFGDYPANDVVDPQGPKGGEERVLRGGSFTDIAQNCRSASRHKFEPNGRDPIIGFRVCFSVE